MKNIIEILEEAALKKGDQVAFTFLSYCEQESEQDITFQQIFHESVKFASRLKKAGIKNHERVIIFAQQMPETIYAVFGTMMARGVFIMLPAPDDLGKKERLKSVIQSAKPGYMIVNEEILQKISQEKMEGYYQEKGEKKLVLVDISKPEEGEIEVSDFHREKDELAYLQYSSGSTSVPKGIMISYGNMIKSLEANVASMPKYEEETCLAWLPFYHNLGILCAVLRVIYAKSHIYIMKTEDFMENPMRWIEAMSKYKVQVTAGPNSAYGLCAKIATDDQIKNLDLTRLNFAVNGAEPVNYETLCAFADKFAQAGFKMDGLIPSYGLAEVVCGVSTSKNAVHIQHIDVDAYRRNRFIVTQPGEKAKIIVSQGIPYKYVNVVIVNPDTLQVCEKDEIGEIWISGDVVSIGYWGQNQEEDTVFHQKIPGYEEEFLRTGDYGIVYDGEVYVTGRIKDMLIVNGHNVYPIDIINDLQKEIPQLLGQPISIFDIVSHGKERVVICMELAISMEQAGSAEGKTELCLALSKRMKKLVKEIYDFSPYDIVFVLPNTLSKTDNGKLKKYEIKNNYENDNLQIIYSEKKTVGGMDKTQIVEITDDMEKKIKEIFESVLGCQVNHRNSSFLEMGGNSFDTVELVKKLEKEYSVKLELKEVMADATVCGVAEMIRARKNNRIPIIKSQDLYQECKLEETIYPEQDYRKRPDQCDTIFITGTTGFLGAYLIASLIEQNREKNLQLFCHVRARDEASGFERIKRNMEEYGLWKEEYKDRIFPVTGNLEEPLLGMTREKFDELAEKVDMIYHNGALLHFLYPYNYLKKINVLGTVECLKLACAKRAKYFNYISSFSVFDNPSHFHTRAMEDDLLESSDGYFLGYSETKWVSEKIIEEARKRGVKTIVYRPGEITGSTNTGKWKVGDLVSRSLIACIQMGQVPDTSSNYYLTPVDFVAEAAAYISFQEDAYNHAYNLVNTNIMSIQELAETFRSFGYGIRDITYEQWQKNLFESNTDDNSLKIMESLFQGSREDETAIVRRYGDVEAEYDISNMETVLKDSGIICKPVTRELIYKYIRNFMEQDCILEPAEQTAATKEHETYVK